MAWSKRGKRYFIMVLLSSTTVFLLFMVEAQLHSDVLSYPDYKNNSHAREFYANTPTINIKGLKKAQNYDKKYEELCRGPWQTNYQKLHEKILKTSKQFLVFKCSSAGWGNRLRALLSSLYLAVISKRAFIIDCPKPSPLEKYLEPKFIKWNYHINTSGSSIRFQNPQHRPLGKGWNNTDFEKYFNHSVEGIENYGGKFFVNENPKYNLPRWPNRFLFFGCGFHFLFKKSKYLEKRLAQKKRQLGFEKNIVLGIHIRRGDAGGLLAWNKVDLRVSKIQDTDRYFRCAEKINKRIQEKYQTKKIIWFLATDSMEIKKYAKRKYSNRVKQLYGPIEHVGHPKNGNEDVGHLSMFLDFFLLQQSDFRLFTTGSTFDGAVSIATLGNDNLGDSKYEHNKTRCILPPLLQR